MIDDSIVRGTTSDRIVKMLQGCGSQRGTYDASAHRHFCGHAISVPMYRPREQLIAYNRTSGRDSADDRCR